jgi:hypothetical protein
MTQAMAIICHRRNREALVELLEGGESPNLIPVAMVVSRPSWAFFSLDITQRLLRVLIE